MVLSYGPKVIGKLTSQLILISQVYYVTSLVQVEESVQYLILIVGFWLPLESVIAVCQSCANDSQGSDYEAEK